VGEKRKMRIPDVDVEQTEEGLQVCGGDDETVGRLFLELTLKIAEINKESRRLTEINITTLI